MFFSASGHLYLLAAVVDNDKTGLEEFVSDDGGDTFDKPVVISPPSDIMAHGEMGPRFLRDRDQQTIYALWEGGDMAGKGDQLHVAHASMFGHSFSEPVSVIDKTRPSSNGFATLGTAPNGDVYAAWLDGRDGRTSDGSNSIYVVRSTDHGATFGPNVRVAKNSCPCCRPSFAFADDGTIYVAWRQVYPGDYRDIVVASSRDSGATWSSPARVRQDGWSIRGCPDSGPSLTLRDNHLYVAWFTLGREGRDQLLVSSSDDGVHFAPPVSIARNVDDANHPKFVEGPAPYPIIVFVGRDAKGAGFGPLRPFVTSLRGGVWSAPEGVPGVKKDVYGASAVMRDPSTIFIAGTTESGNRSSVVLIRGRLP